VHRLKHDFPQLTIVINGGLQSDEQLDRELRLLDGAMIGREAYHNPWWLASWDERYFGAASSKLTREDVEAQMVDYMLRVMAEEGQSWYGVARHMLGLRHGLPGARRWRQVWSDHRLKARDPREVMALAHGRDDEREPLAA
jgi:tRNA-dihydrouridine synthase A